MRNSTASCKMEFKLRISSVTHNINIDITAIKMITKLKADKWLVTACSYCDRLHALHATESVPEFGGWFVAARS